MSESERSAASRGLLQEAQEWLDGMASESLPASQDLAASAAGGLASSSDWVTLATASEQSAVRDAIAAAVAMGTDPADWVELGAEAAGELPADLIAGSVEGLRGSAEMAREAAGKAVAPDEVPSRYPGPSAVPQPAPVPQASPPQRRDTRVVREAPPPPVRTTAASQRPTRQVSRPPAPDPPKPFSWPSRTGSSGYRKWAWIAVAAAALGFRLLGEVFGD